MMKKILCGLLAASLAAGALVSCGNDGGSSSSSGSSEPESSASASESSEESGEEETQLEKLTFRFGIRKRGKRLFQRGNEHRVRRIYAEF